jgi:hypothetical protein
VVVVVLISYHSSFSLTTNEDEANILWFYLTSWCGNVEQRVDFLPERSSSITDINHLT